MLEHVVVVTRDGSLVNIAGPMPEHVAKRVKQEFDSNLVDLRAPQIQCVTLPILPISSGEELARMTIDTLVHV